MKSTKLIFIPTGLLIFSSPLYAEDCRKAVDLYNQGTLSKDFKEKEAFNAKYSV